MHISLSITSMVLCLAVSLNSPMAFAAGPPINGLNPSAAMGIQLAQPATTMQKAGTVLEGVVASQSRFNELGGAGAKVGDKLQITVIVPDKVWSVKNLRTGVTQKVGVVGDKLSQIP